MRRSAAPSVVLLCLISLAGSAGCERDRPRDRAPTGTSPRPTLAQRPPTDFPRFPAAPGGVAGAGEVLQLRTVGIHDPVVGQRAFTVLLPIDWQSQGAVLWRFRPVNCAAPAGFVFHALGPGGGDELWLLDTPTFSWARAGIPFFPEGSFYLGNEVRPPVDAAQYIRTYAIPRFRGDLQSARLTNVQNLPDLAQAVLSLQEPVPFPRTASAARLSVEYPQQGRLMQEDVYAILFYNEMFPGAFWWGPAASFSFKAEKGRIESEARLFRTITMSFALDLPWYNRYMQWVDVCTQMAMKASDEAVVRSQIISRTNDQISEIRRRAWQNRQEAQARASQKWDDYIRGVERYHNPFEGRQVEVPSGYERVWVNRFGEYRAASNPNYNPNIGSNQDWREMRKAAP